MSQLDDLAAALDNHQITDDEGKIPEDTTSVEESATQEPKTVEEDATAEKSVETKDESTQEESIASENKSEQGEPELIETASDETGKRYVPESRFKEIYAKWKKAEDKAKSEGLELPKASQPFTVPQAKPVDKADALEIELLRTTLPQFNPESDVYSQDIDELGYSIYEGSKDSKGNHLMTRMDAGRKAIGMAKKITSKIADIKDEARTVKAQQSDQGIANRVLTRETTKVDPEKMTLEEKEEWLKANGYW